MSKKYEIVKNSTDNYTLKYKDKSFEFKTDVAIISKMQGIQKNARIKMIKDLSKEGMSLEQLTIKTKKDGKTYEDNTNRDAIEEAYLEEAMVEFFDNVCKEKFDMSLVELLTDMDLANDETEVRKFTEEFIMALTGQIPSGR